MKTILKLSLILIVTSLLSFSSKTESFSRAELREVPGDTIPQKKEKLTLLYIVDGTEMDAKEFNKLNMEDIDQIEYVKKKEEIKKHTEKEVDTVVLITMKKEEK